MRVNLDDLLETRKRLAADIRSRLDEKAGTFLIGLHDGAPDFDAIDRPLAANLPVVRWKLINLEKRKRDSLAKHAVHRSALEALFNQAQMG